ncbi:MAG: rRNA maturation RNase YbeY [Proteobacteria bacterium]|nr:rRNA maturation RNase YbeY [Pseudomonadota bacterium]
MTLEVDVAFGTRRPWSPSARRLAGWARAAGGRAAGRAVLAIRVVTAHESRRLNRTYRGKDRPTNVLSFPAEPVARAARGAARPLGDLAICAAVVAREARRQHKTLEAHWAHMVVHGVLHLLGHDHVRSRDAERMERREVRLLARLGFADPYEVATDG